MKKINIKYYIDFNLLDVEDINSISDFDYLIKKKAHLEQLHEDRVKKCGLDPDMFDVTYEFRSNYPKQFLVSTS